MKTSVKIIAGIVLALALGAVLVSIVCPQVVATRYGYFDVNNGRKKVEWVSFGRVYRRSIEDTEYSKLLKDLDFQETPPDWKLATQEEMGLFFAQYVDYFMGSIQADSKLFALTIELNKPDQTKAREMAEYYRSLVKKGDSSKVRQYIRLLNQKK